MASANATNNDDKLGMSIAVDIGQYDLLDCAIPLLDETRDKERCIIARLRVL